MPLTLLVPRIMVLLLALCEFSDISVFSFHPVKIITTGEGGLATTRDKRLAGKMAAVKSHGVIKDPRCSLSKSDGPWTYEQQSLGFNFRLTGYSGRAWPLADEPFAIKHKTSQRNRSDISRTAERAANQVAAVSFRCVFLLALFVITCDDSARRLDLFNYLRSANIGAQVHYIPVHTQPYYRALVSSPVYARRLRIITAAVFRFRCITALSQTNKNM